MSLHSKGPFGHETIINCILVNDRFGDRIAVLPAQTGAHSHDEQLANARLFEAAPAMLEELKNIVLLWDPSGIDSDFDGARAVIADIEGLPSPSTRPLPPPAHKGRSL